MGLGVIEGCVDGATETIGTMLVGGVVGDRDGDVTAVGVTTGADICSILLVTMAVTELEVCASVCGFWDCWVDAVVTRAVLPSCTDWVWLYRSSLLSPAGTSGGVIGNCTIDGGRDGGTMASINSASVGTASWGFPASSILLTSRWRPLLEVTLGWILGYLAQTWMRTWSLSAALRVKWASQCGHLWSLCVILCSNSAGRLSNSWPHTLHLNNVL